MPMSFAERWRIVWACRWILCFGSESVRHRSVWLPWSRMGRGFSASTTRKKSVTDHFDKSLEPAPRIAKASPRPRVGFLGVGWIGCHRLQSIVESGAVEIAAVADFDSAAASEMAARVPGAVAVPSLDALLELQLDGLVIATPTALHAEQAIAALEKDTAVFCQKPLGRNADETARV